MNTKSPLSSWAVLRIAKDSILSSASFRRSAHAFHKCIGLLEEMAKSASTSKRCVRSTNFRIVLRCSAPFHTQKHATWLSAETFSWTARSPKPFALQSPKRRVVDFSWWAQKLEAFRKFFQTTWFAMQRQPLKASKRNLSKRFVKCSRERSILSRSMRESNPCIIGRTSQTEQKQSIVQQLHSQSLRCFIVLESF